MLEFMGKDGARGFQVALVELPRRKALPNSVLLSSIARIRQEDPRYSGAAVYQMIERHYGYPGTSQAERRRMVDWIRNRSGYQPFDVWRILLRRAATSSATRLEDLPEFSPARSRSAADSSSGH
jgi:hypothetical protein